MRAKAQLEDNGCTHVAVLHGLQMLRAHCGRDSRMDVLRRSARFASIQIDHSISLVAFRAAAAPLPANKTLTAYSVLPAGQGAPSPSPLAAPATTHSFESIEFGGGGGRAGARGGAARGAPRQAPAYESKCYPRGGAGTRVFVIDTGCRASHEQLAGRVRAFASPGSPYQSGEDDHGHGTHVAAMIAGRDFGIAKAAQVTCIKALSAANTGSSADVISAIDHVVSLKRRSSPSEAFLMSISLGVRAPRAYSALDAAVARAAAAGVVPIIAAGNAAGDACKFTPARAAGAITVGALAGGRLASFSNRGRCVALAAPGVRVRSAHAAADDAYARSSGTSMAAPHVSGLAALILGERPALAPAAVLRELRAAAGRRVDGIPVAAARRGCAADSGGGSAPRALHRRAWRALWRARRPARAAGAADS